jgi:hypothetical protein
MKLVPVTIEVIGKSEQTLFKKQIQMEAFTEEATGDFVVSHEALPRGSAGLAGSRPLA